MADVITRFKLETTQYDSKLRDASKGLAEYTRQATLAGNEFGKFTQKNVEAARALGSLTPSATNAKDKVKELVGAFNDAAKAYNSLTKEQQQSDFGKAMAESIKQLNDQLKVAKQELYGVGDALNKAGGGGLFSGMGDKLSGALQVFAGNMLTKAAGAVASLGSEMVGMVQQGVELAKQGEGIRVAFERLGRGDILNGLREATHGTVTDLELMKAAVKFNDFKLPLDELGTMLAFAQQKAKDTGQSVDYMVDSIVTGLGRKSLMILDNLGLSATEVKEKMKETGDMTKAVGEIIREQMSKAGDYVETAADRATQANVNLQNKMEELGRKFAPVEEASSQLWTSMKIGILDIIGGPLATLLNQLTEAGRLKNMLNSMNGESGSGNTKVDQQLKKLNVIKKGGGSDYIFNSTLNGMMEDYNRQIMALDAQIKNGGKRPGAGSGESQDVRYLQQKMDALKIMRDQLAAGAKELNKPIKIESNIPNVTGRGGNTKTEPTYAPDSIAAQQALVQQLTKQWNEAGSSVRNQYIQPLVEAEAKLKQMKDEQTLLKEQAEGRLKGGVVETFEPGKITAGIKGVGDGLSELPQHLSPLQEMNYELSRMKELLEYAPDTQAYQDALQKIADKEKEISQFKGESNMSDEAKDSEKAWQKTASAISQVGSALKTIEDPTAQIMGIIAEAIANIALTFSKSLKGTVTPWDWIAAAAAGTATMISTIAAIKQVAVGSYAQGGVIPGNSFSGDNQWARVNAGETILTQAQTGILASQLENAGIQNLRLDTYVTGEQIRLVLNNNGRRTGKGEYVQFKG